MPPARIIILLIAFIAFAHSCGKDSLGSTSTFYGNWVNTNDPNDVLEFSKKNGKNILSYFPTRTSSSSIKLDVEFKYSGGILYTRLLTPPGMDFYPIGGFKWKAAGKEFEWNGNSRYPFLSSIQPAYTYRKLP